MAASHQVVAEANEEGDVKVFFELNGQPRVIRVPDYKTVAASVKRQKAQEGNSNHIGAPMPGAVATVAVSSGVKIRTGDLLLVIEAMKMET
jgi:pyruvate carboxylase